MSIPNRTAEIHRKTNETNIHVRLGIDGDGLAEIDTGIGFFDHMLTAFAFNGCFDLALTCKGDLHIDQHHTVEDVGIALGEAFASALGDNKGIVRYGTFIVPMDEVAVRCTLDLSGRAYLRCDLPWQTVLRAVDFDYSLTSEFHWGFCRSARVTTHIDALASGNNHHLCEASFKAFGRALDLATTRDPRRAGRIPSTKGSL